MWRWLHLAANVSLPFGEDIDKALAVEREGHGPAYLRTIKWRRIPVHDQVGALVRRRYLTHRVWCLLSYVLHQRNGNPGRKREIELARDKGKNGRRAVRNYCPFNAIQVGTTRLPVLWIAHQLDRFVWLVGNELEGPGTNRVLPHGLWRDVARIDGRIPRCKERDKGGLRS